MASHDPGRRPLAQPEDAGIGERVAGHGLERGARDAERGPGRQPDLGPWQPQRPYDERVRRTPAVQQGVNDGGQRHRTGADGEAEQADGGHREDGRRPGETTCTRLTCRCARRVVSITRRAAVGPALRYQGSSSTFTACPASPPSSTSTAARRPRSRHRSSTRLPARSRRSSRRRRCRCSPRRCPAEMALNCWDLGRDSPMSTAMDPVKEETPNMRVRSGVKRTMETVGSPSTAFPFARRLGDDVVQQRLCRPPLAERVADEQQVALPVDAVARGDHGGRDLRQLGVEVAEGVVGEDQIGLGGGEGLQVGGLPGARVGHAGELLLVVGEGVGEVVGHEPGVVGAGGGRRYDPQGQQVVELPGAEHGDLLRRGLERRPALEVGDGPREGPVGVLSDPCRRRGRWVRRRAPPWRPPRHPVPGSAHRRPPSRRSRRRRADEQPASSPPTRVAARTAFTALLHARRTPGGTGTVEAKPYLRQGLPYPVPE